MQDFLDSQMRSYLFFSHFLLGSVKHDLLHRVGKDSDTDDSTIDQNGSLRSYRKLVNHLLSTCADDSTIHTTNAAVTSF